MHNKIKWISKYDFDEPTQGIPTVIAAVVSFVSCFVLLCLSGWHIYQWLPMLGILLVWILIGLLFLTNGPRALSDYKKALYLKYEALPKSLKSDVGTLTYDDIANMTDNDAKKLSRNLGYLQSDYLAHQESLGNPKVQHLIENIENTRSVYQQMKELA